MKNICNKNIDFNTGIMSGVNNLKNTPVSCVFFYKYPNPFNLTVIKYQLPEAGQKNLTVYDLMGREIETMINGS